MHQRVELERARRMFLATGDRGTAEQILRREVVASWERTPRHGVDLNHVAATFSGRAGESAAEAACADEVFDEFFAANGPAAFSLVLFDRSGVVRVRRDGDSSMADLLDDVLLLPGYEYGERVVGTTAWSVALAERADTALVGPEHVHHLLTCFSEAAAVVWERGPGGSGRGGAGVP